MKLNLTFSSVSQETNSYTLEIRAKPQHHRFLIGRGGSNIRKVRENTGARIVFPTPSDEDKELITIIGKKEGVEAAKQELMKAIKDLVQICFQLSDPSEWLASNFSFHPWIENWGHGNKRNDYEPNKLVIVQQIFLVNA